MLTKNRIDKNKFLMESINETELCSKIQRLQSNIKQYYSIENSELKELNNLISEPKKTFTAMKNASNSFTETYSNSEIGEITSSSMLLNEFENEINEESDKNCSFTINNDNTLIENRKNQTSHCKADIFNFQNVKDPNFVPQRTLAKIMVLEKLILNFEESIDKKNIPNKKIKLKLMNLLKEFNNVKSKLERGSYNELLDSEVLELMKQMKMLFENFYQIQNEFVVNSPIDKDSESNSECDQSARLPVQKYPVRPPRRFSRVNISKEKCHISNVTSSSEDLHSSCYPEANFRNNKSNSLLNMQSGIKLLKPMINNHQTSSHENIVCDNKFSGEVNDFEKTSSITFNENEINSERKVNNPTNEIIYPQNVSYPIELDDSKSEKSFQNNSLSLNTLSINDEFEKTNNENSRKFPKNSVDIKPKIKSRISKSVGNLYQTVDWYKKCSRLPILKKESINRNFIRKTGEISSISQTITNKVLNNLKQLGYLAENKSLLDMKTSPRKCKTKHSNKSFKSNNQTQVMKNPDEILNPASDLIFLIKLNSYHCKNIANADFVQNKNLNNSHSRIYCLEKLLKKGKYKFIDTNKLISHEKQNKIHENTNFLSNSQNKNQTKLDGNLKIILSLLGSSSKIIHQIIFFPSTSLEINPNEKIEKVPRLANIENICRCRIKILITDEINKKRIKPIKNLLALEIYYDLRKGKALGCINMLRHLAGQRNKEIKIFRTSVLLPGGYLKEMTCCSINELVNLSMHAMENLKHPNGQRKEDFKNDNQHNKIKLRLSSIKQKPKIIKTFSMGCIASS